MSAFEWDLNDDLAPRIRDAADEIFYVSLAYIFGRLPFSI